MMQTKHRDRRPDAVKKTGLICGIVYATIGFIIRLCAPSPLNMIHVMGADVLLPPMWIFNMLSLFWFFISGFAFGIIMGKIFCKRICGQEEILSYRGSLFFIAMFFMSLMWYPLFFCGTKLFFSFIISVCCLICSCMCAFLFKSVHTLSCLAMCTNSLWLFYVSYINLAIMLRV